MNRKHITFIILSSIVLGGIGGWLLMRFVIPELNTIQILRKYNLNPKTAPLTINTREEIRVNEGSDSVAAIQRVKPWLVSIVNSTDPAKVQVGGAGVIITSDGLIATLKSAVPTNANNQATLQDGTVLPATIVATDPASDLVLLKVETSNLPTASLGFPKDLQLGQRIIVLSPSLAQYQGINSISFLSSEVKNIKPSQVLFSDRLYRTFGVSAVYDAVEGAAVLSLDANIQGLFGKNGIVTADVIKSALNSYYSNTKIQRVITGLYYQVISKAESSLLNMPEGVLVKRPDLKTPAVVVGSPAGLAGIQEGDVITKVNDTSINVENSFEELLSNFSSGQTATFTLVRAGQTKTVTVTFGQQ